MPKVVTDKKSKVKMSNRRVYEWLRNAKDNQDEQDAQSLNNGASDSGKACSTSDTGEEVPKAYWNNHFEEFLRKCLIDGDNIYEELMDNEPPERRIWLIKGHLLDIAKAKEQDDLEIQKGIVQEGKKRKYSSAAVIGARLISKAEDEIKNKTLKVVSAAKGIVDFLVGIKEDLAEENPNTFINGDEHSERS